MTVQSAPQIFDHARFDVYHVALEFVTLADRVIAELPRGCSNLTDELDRAATSIVLNIAEGAGEFAPKEKVRFYRMAKRSGTECAALLDIARHRKLVLDAALLSAGRHLLLRIVSMIIRMVQAAERERGRERGRARVQRAARRRACRARGKHRERGTRGTRGTGTGTGVA